MIIISLIGQKGGTGKTTLAQSLAVAAERDGLVTAAIDLDPQVSLCRWSDLRGQEAPIVLDTQPARLVKTLATAKDQGVGMCVVDTAGRAEAASLAAAKAADLVVLPLQPTYADLATVDAAQDILKLAGSPRTLAVLTRVKPRGARHVETSQWLESQGIQVCPHFLGDRVIYQDAAAAGLTAQEFEPSGKAAEEVQQVYVFIRNLLNT